MVGYETGIMFYMKKSFAYYLIGFFWMIMGCEKWYTTEDVSHVSNLPKFELMGGEFISIQKSDTSEFEDPGVTAYADGEELTVYASGEVDLAEVGVYIIKYFALNQDNLLGIAERIVAVTHHNVSGNDLSGTYSTEIWSPVESKMKKIETNGLYESDDVMGFPGYQIHGRFVDLGNNELELIHGEGYFGRYSASEGSYTRSTLAWTIFLIDPPYEGVEIEVLWRKNN